MLISPETRLKTIEVQLKSIEILFKGGIGRLERQIYFNRID